jgi:hypothetical protein
MRIAGIDVSRGKITVCILDRVPEDLKRFKRSKFLSFKADREGIEDLLSKDFDAAILEPTGFHYSAIWAHHIQKSGREVRWVGHWEVAEYRNSWKTFNKSDRIDALALACYGIERWHVKRMFITPTQLNLRQLYLQLEHLNRVKNPVINRLRQELEHDFPEVANKDVTRPWLSPNPPGLWRALASDYSDWAPKWKKELDRSIGRGISTFTRRHAQLLCFLEQQECEIEQELAEELSKPEFEPYLRVLERYDLRNRTAAALLSAIYPIDQFLEDGRVITEHVDTEKGRARRNRSLAAFKLACGVGMVWVQSGDYEGWKAGGSASVRSALWRWAVVTVRVRYVRSKSRGIVINPEIEQLRAYYEKGSTQTIGSKRDGFDELHFDPGKGNQRIMRVIRRLLDRLFKDLVRELT